MANVDRDNMLNEEQESSQSNSSNGSGAVLQQQQSLSGGFQLKSSILRQPATFGSGAGAGGGMNLFGSCSSSAVASGPINSFNLKPSVLKPSHLGGFGGDKLQQLDQNQTNSNSFGSNPFLKTQASEEDSESRPDDERPDKEDNSDPLAKLNRSSLPKSNLFANVTSIRENKGFVFGQNVHERVTGDNLPTDNSNPTAGLSFSTAVTNNSNDSSSSNSAAVAGASAPGSAAAGSKPGESGGGEESLEEAARKYEESRGALKRKFDEVETITGEEDERNVVEVTCKLFAFAKSNWEERGHGMLRLNDKDNKESRVVFRQSGNLRVLINTQVWSGMIADQSSQKSLRLTAMDNNGQVGVFLVMSRPDIIAKLHKELTKRIQTAKETAAEQDDEAGKENNDDNASSAAAAVAKPSEDNCEDVPESVKDEATSPGSDEPSAKKRLSASS